MRGADRISELHDTLLTQILSYLPTKEAVQTCLLSKRWKKVWASVPVLDFDFADFWSDDIFSPGQNVTYESFISKSVIKESKQLECHNNFVRYIDTVLALREAQPVDRFRLVWQYPDLPYHNHPVRRWILHILNQRPRVLSIYVQPDFVFVEVPMEPFTCSSLEEMKLQVDDTWLQVLDPVSVSLPNLRKLNLGYFTIEADFMSNLLLGCPNLAELELYACNLDLSHISCGNLKSLVIAGCYHAEEIRISIPSLQYLEVSIMSCQTLGFVFKNMSSLVKARVCFFGVDHLDLKFLNSESKILSSLLGVTNLDVVLYGSRAKDMLEHALKNCNIFQNLNAAHFESFKGYLYGCIGVIDRLVLHAPFLEDLAFYCCEDKSDEIELLKAVREVVGDRGNCRQKHTYGSLDELEELYIQSFALFDKLEDEEDEDEDEDEDEEEEEEEEEEEQIEEDVVGGGEALLAEEAGEDGEADLGEEDEQDVEQ
ncbi:hypothetical protein LUZ61_019917 [Rhynchospora tenuis]|uniref:F-box domain-containing protein n=1 Tax=Rhynchospora tenuis TaxID=198213 RepID=A0AAD6ENB5_9POAL|nr:hypothetical protein LUZ61_019917 [Rhynchospora tenuis]